MGKHCDVAPSFAEAGPLLDDPSVHDPPNGDATNLHFCSGRRKTFISGAGMGSLKCPQHSHLVPFRDHFLNAHPEVWKRLLFSVDRILICLQVHRPVKSVVLEIRRVDFVRHLELSLVENFIEYSHSNGLVSRRVIRGLCVSRWLEPEETRKNNGTEDQRVCTYRHAPALRGSGASASNMNCLLVDLYITPLFLVRAERLRNLAPLIPWRPVKVPK